MGKKSLKYRLSHHCDEGARLSTLDLLDESLDEINKLEEIIKQLQTSIRKICGCEPKISKTQIEARGRDLWYFR